MKTRQIGHRKTAASVTRRDRPERESGSGSTVKTVRFFLERPGARSVSVVGSFNNWDALQSPLSRDMEGGWKVDLSLEPGRYEYRFLVDGQWLSDPNAPECVENQFGSTNSVLIVD